MLTSEIVTKVQGEGVSPAEALSTVNEVYFEANAEARWRRSAAQLTTTVANQANYALDIAVVDLDAIRIGTTVYSPVSQETIWGYQSAGWTPDEGGVFAPDFESGDQFEICPAPTTTGDPIMGIRVIDPVPLTTSPDTTPIFPADLHGLILVDGSLAKIRARTDERLESASYFQARRDKGVELMRQRAIRRVGGNRPRQAKLYGRDFTIR